MRGFVYLNFSRSSVIHRNRFWVEVEADLGVGNEHYVTTNADASVAFSVVVNTLVNTYMKPMFSSAIEFQSAELWLQPTDDDNPVFRQFVSLAIAGTNATATTVGLVFSITFYNEMGNAQKMMLVEPSGTANIIENAPYAAGILKTFTDHIISSAGWIRSKNGGKFVGNKRLVTKIHDALRKKSLGL